MGLILKASLTQKQKVLLADVLAENLRHYQQRIIFLFYV